MAFEQAILRKAAQRLADTRRNRTELADARRKEIYRSIPRIAEIDRLLRKTIAEIITTALREGRDPAPAIGVIRDKNMDLQAERAELLSAHGYSFDALDDVPLCPKCNDTGWAGSKMCSCLKELCSQEQIKNLSSLLNLGEQSFELFQLDYYPAVSLSDNCPSPRENMECNLRLCKNYATKFGRYTTNRLNNLFFNGPPGLGKTFLSACIARTVSESGFSVVYDTAINIFSRFEDQKFSRDVDARDETRRYLACDLLIMDDLGSEMTTPFVQTALYTLINARLAAEKRTIISSNLSISDVRQRYLAQTASRLEGEYESVPFFGEDIRLLRKQKM